MSDPWHGPAKPGFFTGLGYTEDTAYLGPSYRVFEAAGSGAAKIERVLGDLVHQSEGFNYDTDESGGLIATPAGSQSESEGLNPLANAIIADAKMRVAAMTPDPRTTGTAVGIVHGVGEGAYLATVGGLAGGVPGAAALTGGVEGSAKYHELIEQGVSPAAALESAGVTAVASGAGVLIPGGFGSTLASKLLTGAGAQVGLGFASRYADHKILEANGYPEMAAQQKVWDSTQVLIDALLGVAFGGLAHLHGREAQAIKGAANEPGVVDAALVANLASHDRSLSPGVPVDPAATHAHGDALEVSNEQLLAGEPNDISQTGVNEAKFAQRPVDEARQAEAQAIAHEYVPEAPATREAAPPEQASTMARPEIAETTEEARANNEPYLPADEEIAAVGGKPSPDNADRVALIARAAQIDPARVEALAAQHAGDANEFVKAARTVIDEHAATAQRGEGGAVAQGQPSERGGDGRRAGNTAAAGTAAGADESAGGGAGPASSAAAAGEPAAAAGAGTARVDRLADTVQSALKDRPALQVTGDEGKPVPAADLLRQVQEDAANEMADFQKAVMAATNCFGRRGA